MTGTLVLGGRRVGIPVEDHDLTTAWALMDRLLQDHNPSEPWVCPVCRALDRYEQRVRRLGRCHIED